MKGHTKYISKALKDRMGRKLYSVCCDECEFLGSYRGDKPGAEALWQKHLTHWDKDQKMMLDAAYGPQYA